MILPRFYIFLLWALFLPMDNALSQDDPRIQEAHEAYQAGEVEKALNLYETILQTRPLQEEALQWAGLIRYHSMDYKKSEALFQALHEQGGGYYPSLMLGNCALQQYEPFKARDYYLRALELNPEDQTLAMNLSLSNEHIARAKELARLHQRATTVFYLGICLGAAILLSMVILEIRSIFKTPASPGI